MSTNWINSVWCYDKFQGTDYLKTQFAKKYKFVCPDIENFTLNSDFFTVDDIGTSIVMVVNKCSVATQIDTEYGLTSYLDVGCDEDSENRIDEIMVQMKILEQSTDPDYYFNNGHSRGVFDNR